MAEAWRKFEEEAQQMRKVEMNAYQYGEKKDMESNVIMQQMRQAEGTIMEQKREIAVMKSYMASEKSAAQESATHANQIHREASQQISVYQQQIRGIKSSTPIEKFNEEEMVQSLKSQLEHALVKRPETYSMEDCREQLMARLNDVTLGLFRRKMTFYFWIASHVSHVEVFPPLVESVDITSGPL